MRTSHKRGHHGAMGPSAMAVVLEREMSSLQAMQRFPRPTSRRGDSYNDLRFSNHEAAMWKRPDHKYTGRSLNLQHRAHRASPDRSLDTEPSPKRFTSAHTNTAIRCSRGCTTSAAIIGGATCERRSLCAGLADARGQPGLFQGKISGMSMRGEFTSFSMSDFVGGAAQ